jgi:polyisoprenoid-binding protein YceI
MTDSETQPVLRIVAYIALCLLPAAAGAAEWQVDTAARGNQVRFTSEVAALSFSGVTDQVDGFYYCDGPDLFAGSDTLRFEVDLRTLRTGIGKRDRDMREVLATDRWPRAVFAGTIATQEPVDTAVVAFRVIARGTLSLHGVDRPLELPGTLVVGQDGSSVATRFTMRLEDFDIRAPTLAAFIKVSQEVIVDALVHMKRVR